MEHCYSRSKSQKTRHSGINLLIRYGESRNDVEADGAKEIEGVGKMLTDYLVLKSRCGTPESK